MILIAQIDPSRFVPVFYVHYKCILFHVFKTLWSVFLFLISRMNQNNQNNPLYMMLPHVLYGHIAPRPRTPPYSKESRPKYSPLTPSPIGSPKVYYDHPKFNSETYFLLIQAMKKLELLKLHKVESKESSEDEQSVSSGEPEEPMDEEESKQ